ncbi:MAG: hypothetical protein ACLR56_04790 [Oscillospiraceae bacterium]
MTSYERRKIWYDMLDKDMPLIDKRISDGIEKNRKGNIQIKLTDKSGRPVAGKRENSSKATISSSAQIYLCLKALKPKGKCRIRKGF